MHFETLNYATIKAERTKYKNQHKGDAKNFDKEFISHLETKYGIRFFDIRQCKENINLRAYDGITTITIPVLNFSDHETTAKFVQSVGALAVERARAKPGEISDKLTQAARNQICNPNDVYKNFSNVNRLLQTYLV